ncbi:MAG: hypothetical protein A3F68_06575 [Acidobacteria bacterium RIFCSPLOWO2_12_FULL_54_10]|nr:MAG: hypothetical protein A3F68_06575 [Acidobacteria bacterium RIFCSPLOWO2_12_FULL_54_10]
MLQAHFKKQFNGRKKQRWILVGSALAIAVFTIMELTGENGYLTRRQQRNQIHVLTEEINQLQQENDRLNQRIQDLHTNPHTIEEMARERLRLAKPGEVIVALPKVAPSSDSSNTPPSNR